MEQLRAKSIAPRVRQKTFVFISCSRLPPRHSRLTNHSVCPRQHVGRNRQADLFGGFEINDQLDLIDALQRQILGRDTRKNTLNVFGGQTANLVKTYAIGGETSVDGKILSDEHSRQTLEPCRFNNELRLVVHLRVGNRHKRISFAGLQCSYTELKLISRCEVTLDKLDADLWRGFACQFGRFNGD